MRVERPFARVLDRYYGVTPCEVDFSRDVQGAHEQINSWVSERTRGMIREVSLPAGRETTAAIINAVYFRAEWEKKFNPSMTRTRKFHVAFKRSFPVRMMRQVNSFGYARVEGCSVVELPYIGKDVSLHAILPESLDELKSVEERLGELDDWTAKLREMTVKVSLPHFAVECRPGVQAALAKMGFDIRRGDFSGMSPGMRFQMIEHVAKIEADEVGTNAAAVTNLGQVVMDEPEVVCERPFLAVIRENSTGAILFLGRISRPTVVEQVSPLFDRE